MDPFLVVILGPTAVGKTELSIQLALALNAEIVSADSRLVYRGMDIGTAKPTPDQLARVPHHLIDVVNPDQVMTLADYQGRALAAIHGIHARGRLPLLVGGTGQYLRSIIEGWQIPRVRPDPQLRSELNALADKDGPQTLHRLLQEKDPSMARRIDARNVRRVVRALEVTIKAGRPMSELQLKKAPPYRVGIVGLLRDRSVLYQRIDARLERMVAAGLETEVAGLVQAGYGLELPALSALGYSQIGDYLEGEVTWEEALARIRKETRRFLRQQMSWFRAVGGVEWFDLDCVGFCCVLEYVGLLVG